MPISNPLPFPSLTQDKMWEGNASNEAVEVFHPTLPGAHHTPAVAPKVKLETRNMAAAIGDVAYTGYGFRPTGLIILSVLVDRGSVGSSEPALAEHNLYGGTTAGQSSFSAYICSILTSNINNWQMAVLKTYDADGFTLTWTKGGTPTGIAQLHVFAFK